MALLLAACCFFFQAALADDAGVLTENELNQWIMAILRESASEQPLNAPIGEDALTPDGYAFLYSFATLYYDRAELSSGSVLKGFVPMEGKANLRGIGVGSPVQMLVDTFGWQNTTLMGDGTFAAFYALNNLPSAAYWAWAQLENGEIRSVQCAVHALIRDGIYTDAGIEYRVDDGVVSSVKVYGLDKTTTLAQVNGNLDTLASVQAAASGDDALVAAQGNYEVSTAAAFGQEDLRFAGIDFLTLDEAGAAQTFGQPVGRNEVQDDTGDRIATMQYEGATLTYTQAKDTQTSRLEMLSLTRTETQGPRGVQIGDTLTKVLTLFRSDGTGATRDGVALLYGDGIAAPYGTLEKTGAAAVLRYTCEAKTSDGQKRMVTMDLSFTNDLLKEITVYSWE